MEKRDAYLAQVQAQLPTGPAWPREPGTNLAAVLRVFASRLADIDDRTEALIRESDPRTLRDMLPEWENGVGLPDGCTTDVSTLQERQMAVAAKVSRKGRQSPGYYKKLAAALGYVIEIEEFRPFVCGMSQCGIDALNGGERVRSYWRVRVIGARATYFRMGVSEMGDSLLKISRAEDLECLLNRLKLANTQLIFAYQGV